MEFLFEVATFVAFLAIFGVLATLLGERLAPGLRALQRGSLTPALRPRRGLIARRLGDADIDHLRARDLDEVDGRDVHVHAAGAAADRHDLA